MGAGAAALAEAVPPEVSPTLARGAGISMRSCGTLGCPEACSHAGTGVSGLTVAALVPGRGGRGPTPEDKRGVMCAGWSTVGATAGSAGRGDLETTASPAITKSTRSWHTHTGRVKERASGENAGRLEMAQSREQTGARAPTSADGRRWGIHMVAKRAHPYAVQYLRARIRFAGRGMTGRVGCRYLWRPSAGSQRERNPTSCRRPLPVQPCRRPSMHPSHANCRGTLSPGHCARQVRAGEQPLGKGRVERACWRCWVGRHHPQPPHQ
jgi:hypothetical protein